MKKKLQKGLSKVQYKTKQGLVTKWRVRINRSDLQVNRLFDDIETALELLKASESQVGKSAIKEALKIEEKEDSPELDKLLINNLLVYFYTHYRKETDNPIDKRNNSIYQNIINTICNTELKENDINRSPVYQMVLQQNKKKFGQFNIFEIQPMHINEYISLRLNQGIAKGTVKKEIAMLSSFFNNFCNYYGEQYNSLRLSNPCKLINKKRITTPLIKRKRRLSEEEETRLEESLMKCRNKDMLTISMLALYTGMRRSEIIYLTWEQVKKNYIILTRTKNDTEREVPISKEVHQILDSKIRGSGRIFKYTLEGFKTNFSRVLKRANLTDFKFRDLRNEFISRLLEKNYNVMVASELAGISNINYFENSHTKQHKDEERRDRELTPEDVGQIVGHKQKSMTKHYFRFSSKK